MSFYQKSHALNQSILRSSRRETSLAKRRFVDSTNPNINAMDEDDDDFIHRGTSTIVLPPTRKPASEQLQQYALDLSNAMNNSNNPVLILDALANIHKFLRETNYAKSNIIHESGMLTSVVFLILHFDPLIVSEAIDVLLCYTEASSDGVIATLNENALTSLSKALQTQNLEIFGKIVLLLGNMAGDCSKVRDILLNEHIVDLILQIVDVHRKQHQIMVKTSFLIGNLCRHEPFVNVSYIKPLIPVIKSFVGNISINIADDAMWSINFLSQNPDNGQLIIDSGFDNILMKALDFDNRSCYVALTAINKLSTDSDDMAKHFIHLGLLAKLARFTSLETDKRMLGETFFLLANLVFVGTINVIQRLINPNVPESTIFLNCIQVLLGDCPHPVKKEVGWFFVNCILVSPEQAIVNFIQIPEFYESFVMIFENDDTTFLCNALDALLKLVAFDSNSNNNYAVVQSFEQCKLTDTLAALDLITAQDIKMKLRSLSQVFKWSATLF
ncbi:Importin alpha [Entamoeba marina]